MESITPEEMGSIEDRAEAIGVSKLLLMENAGASLAREIRQRIPNIEGKRIVFVTGSGNNGGDAMVCARHLASDRAKVMVFLLKNSESLKTSESLMNWKILEKMPKSVDLYQNTFDEFVPNLVSAIGEGDVIVDGILGTGINGRLREPIPTIIEKINSSNAYKVAVDIPTGLDPATGNVSDVSIKADLTVTFHKVKAGLIGNLRETGEIVVALIGIPPEATKD
ncbi:MAG: NAD(P)H-hydrate epimerase [Nitrososphaerales archaeon]